jgi:hypothetical protein
LLVKKVNEKATYDYLPMVYSGRVMTFQPKTFFFGQNDPAFGWEEVVRNGLLVRQLPFYPQMHVDRTICKDFGPRTHSLY